MFKSHLLRHRLAAVLFVCTGGSTASLASTPDTADEAANMQTARNLYAAIFTARDFELAERNLGPEFIQHAGDVADGKAGLARLISEIDHEFPEIRYDIKHISAEGNLVTMMTHVHWTPGSLGTALSSIYRLSDGKIVEHWETIQDVPADSANGNGMF